MIFRRKTACEVAWREQDPFDIPNGVCPEGPAAGTRRADKSTWVFDQDAQEQVRNWCSRSPHGC